jgi:predicted RNA-binding protein Jag
MSKKKEFTGKDLNEALNAAASNLGISIDDVHYRFIDEGRKGILGMGARAVRIEIQPPLRQPAADSHNVLMKGETPVARGDRSGRGRGGGQQRGERNRDQNQNTRPGSGGEGSQPAGEAGSEAVREEGAGRGKRRRGRGRGRGGGGGRNRQGGERQSGERQSGERQSGERQSGERQGGERQGGERQGGERGSGRGGKRNRNTGRGGENRHRRSPVESQEPVTVNEEQMEQMADTLRQLLGHLKHDMQVSCEVVRTGVRMEVTGGDQEMLSKNDGEFLFALQFLLNRMSRRTWPDIGRIQMVSEGHRSQRDEELAEEVKEVAGQVAHTGQAKALHAMNPYERRIVHITVREFGGLVSESEGEGFRKRVTISPSPSAGKTEEPVQDDA